MTSADPTTAASLAELSMRSLFPLAACALLAATPWLGPWALAGATYVWWRIVTRIA